MKTLTGRLRNPNVTTSAFSLLLIMIAAQIATAQQQTNIFPPDGNAGAGTTSPTLQSGLTNKMIEVKGSVNPGVGLTSTSGGGRQYFVYSSAANPGYFSVFDATAGADRFVISHTGNVGIGTETPGTGGYGQGRFDVVGRLRSRAADATLTAGMWLNDSPSASGSADQAFIGRSPTSTTGFWNATGWVLNVHDNGNVGIGTSAPLTKIHASSASPSAPSVIASTDSSGNSGSGVALWSGWSGGGAPNTPALIWTAGRDLRLGGGITDLGTGWGFSETMRITSDGKVGIGIDTPTKKLHVAGDIQVDGNINAKYQDVAEWVPSVEKLSPGTVVVLDRSQSNHVISSTARYDTRVAGVISEQPGIALGERGEGKVLVATTGRVRMKVDATRAPIQIGDLLVTSDIPGVAMKSEAVNLSGVELHRPGTIVGKALEPLAKGKGEILVLLSLQ